MDTDDKNLWEQEEKLLNRMIDSTNRWDGKHVVIHALPCLITMSCRQRRGMIS